MRCACRNTRHAEKCAEFAIRGEQVEEREENLRECTEKYTTEGLPQRDKEMRSLSSQIHSLADAELSKHLPYNLLVCGFAGDFAESRPGVGYIEGNYIEGKAADCVYGVVETDGGAAERGVVAFFDYIRAFETARPHSLLRHEDF